MAELTLWSRLPGWFSEMILFCWEGVARATYSTKPPEWYMDRAAECMYQVERMSSESNSTKLEVYHGQCKYLARQLETAVKSSRESFDRSFPLERKAECLDTLKLLYRVAKEVESFIRDCCNEATWMQAALTHATVPVRVSSWGCQLKLCTQLLRKLGGEWLTVTEVEGLGEADREAVKEMGSGDEGSLMRLLESLTSRPSRSKSRVLKRDIELAFILLERLKAKSSGGSTPSSHLEAWKVGGEEFYLQKSLGRGSFASVHKAKWLGSMEVALKSFTRPFDNGDIFQEVGIWAGLAHPNIVSFLGFSTTEESCSIVLELMDGDLRILMERRMQEDITREAPFSIWEACDIMLQVAEGVKYMHQNGVVHRDLKSRNIQVKSSRDDDAEHVCAKVTYFSFSKRNEKSRTYSDQTVFCTTRWMAPEILDLTTGGQSFERREGVLKHPFKSDVYSFGMLCYETLTGNVPFSDVGLSETKWKVLRGDRPKLPSQCPQILKNLIELCWDPKPSTRPAFAEICEELVYIRCSLLLGTCPLEPLDQNNTPQSAQPVPFEAPVFPQQVSRFKGEYSAFKLLSQLGTGGSDIVTVYRSTWSRPNNGAQVDVAQKRFIGSRNECFMSEVSIMAGLEHRNVVRLRCYATDRRSCSIMMELMDEDLHNLMRRRRLEGNVTPTGPFSMDEAVHVILQIAHGMEYVHGKNVVHRDLKSCNILVRRGAKGGPLEVKVADFGLSMNLPSRGTLLEKDESGVGTPRWMAPEVTRLTQYDPFKSDVFSFGMVCYEILVGKVPFFEMEDVYEVRTKVLAGERPTLPEWTLSRGLKDLVENCWQEDAHKRPSFAEIVKKLTQTKA